MGLIAEGKKGWLDFIFRPTNSRSTWIFSPKEEKRGRSGYKRCISLSGKQQWHCTCFSRPEHLHLHVHYRRQDGYPNCCHRQFSLK